MLVIAIAWIYVVLMMALAEATHPNGTVLGAVFTFLLYGVLPLSIVLYLLHTPTRRRARRGPAASAASRSVDPDQRSHAPGDAVASERIEP
jgi:hypothetical protein